MIFLNLLIIFNRKKREGIQLVLGKIFGDIGFNQITNPIFKQLVLYRLVYPGSKLKQQNIYILIIKYIQKPKTISTTN